MPPSSSQLLPLRGQIELDSLRINAPESPHDALIVCVTLFGNLSASQSPQLASATSKSPPATPAHATFFQPIAATARPGRARFTQNKRPLHQVAPAGAHSPSSLLRKTYTQQHKETSTCVKLCVYAASIDLVAELLIYLASFYCFRSVGAAVTAARAETS